MPARTSPTLLPHPLALCCHYPVSKCRSASIVATSTVRVKDTQFISTGDYTNAQLVYRQLKKININQFRDDINSDIYLNGKFLKEETDCNTCVKVYDDAARSLLDRHAPEKTRLVTIRPKVEWYTQAVDRARGRRENVRGSGEQPNSPSMKRFSVRPVIN